jgi:hypothetical protein
MKTQELAFLPHLLELSFIVVVVTGGVTPKYSQYQGVVGLKGCSVSSGSLSKTSIPDPHSVVLLSAWLVGVLWLANSCSTVTAFLSIFEFFVGKSFE